MLSRIVEISRPSSLTVVNRQLVIEQDGEVVGRVPVEDLGVLILDSYGIVLTQEVMILGASFEIAIIVCDEKHLPCMIALPYQGHNLFGKILRAQISASEPVKKQAWKQTVAAKIEGQAALLLRLPKSAKRTRTANSLMGLSEQVKSGDPNNLEGYAASLYFPALFGKEFIRDREEPDQNAALNYGYAVLRACVARSLVGTGLHPGLGIHHHNQYNAFALADDMMEPLRPMVDELVINLKLDDDQPIELTPTIKRGLLKITVLPLIFAGKQVPFTTALALYAASIKRVICGEARKIEFPTSLP